MTTKASDAAIERVAERICYKPSDYGSKHFPAFTAECDREQALSDALRAHFGQFVPETLKGFVLPVVVDPIVQMVRDATIAEYARRDWLMSDHVEHTAAYQAALSVARAIAAQGGGL